MTLLESVVWASKEEFLRFGCCQSITQDRSWLYTSKILLLELYKIRYGRKV